LQHFKKMHVLNKPENIKTQRLKSKERSKSREKRAFLDKMNTMNTMNTMKMNMGNTRRSTKSPLKTKMRSTVENKNKISKRLSLLDDDEIDNDRLDFSKTLEETSNLLVSKSPSKSKNDN